MKLILLSDFHITSKQPRARLGNIINDLRKKLKFIFKQAVKYDASIVQAGDLFDSPRDIFAIYEFIKIRSKFPKVEFYTIYGQHDSYMRNRKVLNNLSILEKTNQVRILSKDPIAIDNVYLYGASWKEKIPSISEEIPKVKNQINILAVHKSISDISLYKDHNFTQASDFLEKYKFDFILAADAHRGFYHIKDFRLIVNTGPILRLRITDFENQEFNPIIGYNTPRLCLIDTEEIGKCPEFISIPCIINPFDQRFKDEDNNFNFINEEFYKIISEEKGNISIDEVIFKLIDKSNNSEVIINLLSKMENELGFR